MQVGQKHVSCKILLGVVLVNVINLMGFVYPNYRHAFQVWHKNPNITILGNHKARRLPIFSILIHHHDSGKFLHHNFVSVLLNDLWHPGPRRMRMRRTLHTGNGNACVSLVPCTFRPLLRKLERAISRVPLLDR